jgi:hypothetical protein
MAMYSPTTRSIMRPTLAQSMRINSATTLLGAALARYTQVSSNALVNRDPARTHGTCSDRMPHCGHWIRRIWQRNTKRVRARSRCRQVWILLS